MARRRPSTSSASSSPAPIKRCGGHTKPDAVNLDGFVASVYLPHVKVRKLSWQVDERIARQHLSGIEGLPIYGAVRWKTGCIGWHLKDWPQPHATAS